MSVHVLKNPERTSTVQVGYQLGRQFFFDGIKDGKSWHWKLHWQELPTFGMPVDATYISLYVEGKYYDVFPQRPAVGKILLLVEEMGRLHTENWKNFPWLDWIYQ